jgi:hypothetical protein
MKIQNPGSAGNQKNKERPKGFWKSFFRIFIVEFASLSILEVLVITLIVGGGIYYIKDVVQKSYEERLTEKIAGLQKCQVDSQKAAEQNAYDEVRTSDATNILLALQDYNYVQSDLPANLDILKTGGYLDGNINDPEASKPYYYKKLSPIDYVLCVYLTTGVWGTNTSQCPSKADFFANGNQVTVINLPAGATSTAASSTAATSTAAIKKIIVAGTPTGTLNVRVNPSLNAAILMKASTGDEYQVLAEQSGWVEIKLNKTFNLNGTDYSSGWVSEQYIKSE